MPKVNLEDRIAMLTAHPNQISQQQADAVTTQYLSDAQNIRTRVQNLAGAFDLGKCGSR